MRKRGQRGMTVMQMILKATGTAAIMVWATCSLAQPPAQRAVATTSAIAFLDGVWIGPASYTGPGGTVQRFEQMERVGPMMGGQVRVMEGKARDDDGKALFNAFTVFSPGEGGGVTMRSWTMGHDGARALVIDPQGGFSWELKAGPDTVIRYVATVRNGVWDEYGERIGPDGKPSRFFAMKLNRVGGTDWPSANAAFPTKP